MADHEAGVQVTCPSCGQVVMQKAMVPVLAESGHGIRYLCTACARALIEPALLGTADVIDSSAPSAEAVIDPGP